MFKNKRDAGKIYLVFEYMEGGDLRNFYLQRHRRGMPIATVLSFTEQLLLAIQHMHRKGYIHRDIKSGNILIGEPGSLIVNGVKMKYE